MIARVTNAGALDDSISGIPSGHTLGIPLNAEDIDQLQWDFTWGLSPLTYWFGRAYTWLSTGILMAVVVKVLVECIVQTALTYRRRGCGRWIFFQLWGALYKIATAPWEIVKASTQAMFQEERPTVGERGEELPLKPTNDMDQVYDQLIGLQQQINHLRRRLQVVTDDTDVSLVQELRDLREALGVHQRQQAVQQPIATPAEPPANPTVLLHLNPDVRPHRP